MSKSRKFNVVLKDPDSEQRRYYTISRVPCHSCRGISPARDHCEACGGAGEEQGTKDSIVAHLESLEAEYVRFRLDERATLDHYPTLPEDALEIVEQTCLLFPQDAHLVDGRFVRAGKVRPANNRDPDAPAYQKMHKGWMAFHHQEKPYRVLEIGAVDMQAVTGGQYGTPLKNMYGGTRVWDWDTDTIKVALTTSSYTVDIDTNDVFSNITNELTTAGNYTAGGWTLTASAPTYDTATDQIRLDGTDISQASATFTARKAVVYKSTGTASTSPLISYLDFVSDVSPSAGTFSIVWDTTGIFVHDIT